MWIYIDPLLRCRNSRETIFFAEDISNSNLLYLTPLVSVELMAQGCDGNHKNTVLSSIGGYYLKLKEHIVQKEADLLDHLQTIS